MSIWESDLLGFEDIGKTFGNLVKSIDDTKVISIEAGYGRGKTFFRERWAKHLRAEGEVVVEVDALLSDLTGDPVLTFIAALVGALPESDTSTGKKLVESSRKFGGIAARSALRLVLRQGAEEIIDLATGKAVDALGESEKALQEAAQDFGEGLSKSAGDLIASQVAAERLRTVELPEQLKVLRDALTDGKEHQRVVILVDELDRCHPDYAIAFLEAMKLVFGQDGFVFCLFVNADYLQRVADHRFGKSGKGERYLEKFVDFRLPLNAPDEVLSNAAIALVSDLPLETPFGDNFEFSLDRAAKVASDLVPICGLSMRQIEKAILRVEVALRCYRNRPVDVPLLVFLAFKKASVNGWSSANNEFLGRVAVSSSFGESLARSEGGAVGETRQNNRKNSEVRTRFPELLNLARETYRFEDQSDYHDWAKILFLSRHYLPEHQEMLDAVHHFDAV